MNIKIYLCLIIVYKIAASSSWIVKDEGQCMYTVISTDPSLVPSDEIHTCEYTEPYVTTIVTNSTISKVTSNFFNTTFNSWIRILTANNNTWTSVHSFAFSNFQNIQYMDLSGNHINNVGMAFNGLEVLDSLNLSRNHIETIAAETFMISENKTKLHLLDLSYNLLTHLPEHIFVNVYNLRMLYLHGNRLMAIKDESFRYLKNLIYLNLSRNNLTTLFIKMKYLTSLTDLDLSYNNIARLNNHTLSGLVSLQELDLSHNKIKILPDNFLAQSTYLTQINLCHNKIKNISTFMNFHYSLTFLT